MDLYIYIFNRFYRSLSPSISLFEAFWDSTNDSSLHFQAAFLAAAREGPREVLLTFQWIQEADEAPQKFLQQPPKRYKGTQTVLFYLVHSYYTH